MWQNRDETTKWASIETYLGAAFKCIAVGHLWSYHLHSTSFPPVLHQCHDPHLIWTVLSCVLQRNLTEQWNKISLLQLKVQHIFHFKRKKKKNYLSGLVFAAIVDYNDLIGKRGVLFLWERSSGINFTKEIFIAGCCPLLAPESLTSQSWQEDKTPKCIPPFKQIAKKKVLIRILLKITCKGQIFTCLFSKYCIASSIIKGTGMTHVQVTNKRLEVPPNCRLHDGWETPGKTFRLV